MKKMLVVIGVFLAITGCDSEQEKIQKAQVATCRTDILAGKEPTQFCLNLLPEYRNVAALPQPQATQQLVQPQQNYTGSNYQEQQYQQPQVIYQQPGVVPQGSSTGDTIRDMAIGGMIGHAMGSSNQGSNYNSNQRAPNITNITNIRPPVRQPLPRVVLPQAALKRSYMDTSKLNSSGSRPSSSNSFTKRR
jgi:hypothetical protein